MQIFLFSTIAAIAEDGNFVYYRKNGDDSPGLYQTGVMSDIEHTLQFNTIRENTDATMTLMRADSSTSKWKPLQLHLHAKSELAIGG